MAYVAPHELQLTILELWLANTLGQAEPDVALEPPGASWVWIGHTMGNLTLQIQGTNTYHRVDRYTSPIKASVEETAVIIGIKMVNTLLQRQADVIHDSGNLTTATSPTNVTRMGLKKADTPTRRTLCFWGQAWSPYGLFPAQVYMPIAVADGDFERGFARGELEGMDVEFQALTDTTQNDGFELGWITAQTS